MLNQKILFRGLFSICLFRRGLRFESDPEQFTFDPESFDSDPERLKSDSFSKVTALLSGNTFSRGDDDETISRSSFKKI
jgi:hypothetical protein